MATLIVCDGGCGAVSPDPVNHPRGPHIANGWLKVKVQKSSGYFLNKDETAYCRKCEVRVLAVLAPHKDAE